MKKQAGFTLIETLIAIFLLTLTIGGLLTMAAGGYYSVRYARNQIVANNLIQESLEYVRNARDTTIQLGGGTWPQWVANFNVSSGGSVVGGAHTQGCFSSNGCLVDPYTSNAIIRGCPSTCEAITFYPSYGFYGYKDSSYPSLPSLSTSYDTTYVRTITVQENSSDQITVTATVTWMNGGTPKKATQSIVMTNWQ